MITEPRARENGGIRVVIVDDQQLFAEALQPALEENGIEVVGVAMRGSQALAAVRHARPDLVVLNLDLPDENGLDVGRRIMKEGETRVVALSATSNPLAVQEAVGAGFHGVLTKGVPMWQFVASLRAAMESHVVIPHHLAGIAMRGNRNGGEAVLGRHLTPREREILALLVEGLGTRVMAKRLTVSPRTVRTHIQNILSKLNVHSRLEAAAYAVRNGIVTTPRARLEGTHRD